MNLIVKIAWRNIMRHKGKSIIIGVILFLGAFLMTVGNGVISGMDHGLHKNIVNSFTGDIVLISDKQESDNVFLEFMGKAVEPINNFIDIREVLKDQTYIDKYIPVGKNMVMVLNEEGGMPGYTYVIGADLKKYNEMFPNTMEAIEGKLPDVVDAKAVIVPTGARKEMFDYSGIWFIPNHGKLITKNLPKDNTADTNSIVLKDSIVFMGYNNDNTTSDIRLGISTIVKYKALNTILGNFALMDIESYRMALGYFSANDKTAVLSTSEKKLFDMDETNLDALFSENTSDDNAASDKKEISVPLPDTTVKAETAKQIDLDEGVYNLVLIKLKNEKKFSNNFGFTFKKGVVKRSESKNLDMRVAELNKIFKEKNLGVRAITWKKAMGMIGSMAVLIKGALFTFVMFLFFVAIIIIVNTLSMAAIERTTEIGMMRAVGARKGFIRMMFVGETAMLSFVFGGAGIIAGSIIIKIIGLLNFTSDNDMVQLLYGGDTFSPLLTAPDSIAAIVQLALVTVIAVLYPMKVASDITPLDAISRD
jgi:putative ABC transport system permease protein